MPKFENEAVVAMCTATEAACRLLGLSVSDTLNRSRVAKIIAEHAALGWQQHAVVQAAVLRFKSSAH